MRQYNDEVPKHKKKSIAKGLKRSNHKHQYETVLLYKPFNTNSCNFETVWPTDVCIICGKVGQVNGNNEWYIDEDHTKLSDKAFNLPKYYSKDFFDKFADKKEDK